MSEKLHLSKEPRIDHSRLLIKKDREYYCLSCGDRITDTLTRGECGHYGNCPYRPSELPGYPSDGQDTWTREEVREFVEAEE